MVDGQARRRLRIGVLFGGRSGEHEVSLQSARAVMAALEQAGHEVVPIGITPSGRWLVSGDPLQALSSGQRLDEREATMLPEPGHGGLVALPHHSAVPAAPAAADPTEVPAAAEAAGTAGALATRDAPQATDALVAAPADDNPIGSLDLLFPVLHGTYGEDGTVQGLFELASLPYAGAGVLGSALGMDKAVQKTLWRGLGLPVVDYLVVSRREVERAADAVVARVERELGYPCFTKPANLGSSVGVSKARDRTELLEGLHQAARYDAKLLVERGIDARELEVGVLGNDEPQASVVGEIIHGAEFYDYRAKYIDDGSQAIIPADVPAEVAEEVRRLALRAFSSIEGAGLARVDFFLERGSGRLFLNEINTMPGFTRISMYPKLWEASGIGFPELVARIAELGLERFSERARNETSYHVEAS